MGQEHSTPRSADSIDAAAREFLPGDQVTFRAKRKRTLSGVRVVEKVLNHGKIMLQEHSAEYKPEELEQLHSPAYETRRQISALLHAWEAECDRLNTPPHQEVRSILMQSAFTGVPPVVLNLSKQELADSDARALSIVLEKTRGLSTVNLNTNHIGIAGATEIGSALQLNTSLTCLDLGNNLMEGEGAAVMGRMLSRLTTLNLCNNRIRTFGVPNYVPKYADTLQALVLDGNQGLSYLTMEGIGCLKRLRRLSMCNTGVYNLSTTTFVLANMPCLEDLRFQQARVVEGSLTESRGSTPTTPPPRTQSSPVNYAHAHQEEGASSNMVDSDEEGEVSYALAVLTPQYEEEEGTSGEADEPGTDDANTFTGDDANTNMGDEDNDTEAVGSGGEWPVSDHQSQTGRPSVPSVTPICLLKGYRQYLITHLPQLHVLDTVPIPCAERSEAREEFLDMFEPFANGFARRPSLFSLVRSREIGHRGSITIRHQHQHLHKKRNLTPIVVPPTPSPLPQLSTPSPPVTPPAHRRIFFSSHSVSSLSLNDTSFTSAASDLPYTPSPSPSSSSSSSSSLAPSPYFKLPSPSVQTVWLENPTRTGFPLSPLSSSSAYPLFHAPATRPRAPSPPPYTMRVSASTSAGFRRGASAAIVGSSWRPRASLVCPEVRLKPRQFEYHPLQTDLMVFGTLSGDVVVINHCTNEIIGQVRPEGYGPHSILGLSWLHGHNSHMFIAGSDNG
eukprot:CAMPEP_0184665942 /NCGR_PEP_ID=MMETSP0308-20130426/59389_1 /TAXON_ID=38269 /ORGANISM="Gloeochaete witrockiana, Strain SAG 46.84" /LENGTH=728 /DNA_ID=CAMNT_0027110257 /DNA_START=63 /DNA_END=2245 /DNA_ORIENTATION=+